MKKILAITMLFCPLLLSAGEQNNNYSNVLDDLSKMSINTNVNFNDEKEASLLTYNRTADNNYIYFVSSSQINDVKAHISISEKWLEENVSYSEVFRFFSFEICNYEIVNENYYYKAISSASQLLKSKRVFIDSILLDNKETSVKTQYLYTEDDMINASKVNEERQIKITSGMLINRYITNFTTIFDINYVDGANVLDYYFFNTEIDHAIDTITDITINYKYIDWMCKIDEWAIILDHPDEIVKRDYETISNNILLHSWNKANYETTISIADEDHIDVKQSVLFGKKIYDFDKLFKTSETTDEWAKSYSEEYKYACMFHNSKQYVSKSLLTDNFYTLQGTHVNMAKILRISYIADGVSYKNVAADDIFRETSGSVIQDNAEGVPFTFELNPLLQSIKDVIDIVLEVIFYVVIAIIVIIVISLVVKLVGFIKRIGKKKKKMKKKGKK